MIKAVCNDCGHVWWAAVVMGENRCPKCGGKNTCVAIYEPTQTTEPKINTE